MAEGATRTPTRVMVAGCAIITVLMSGTVIALVSAGKDVVFSPYEKWTRT